MLMCLSIVIDMYLSFIGHIQLDAPDHRKGRVSLKPSLSRIGRVSVLMLSRRIGGVSVLVSGMEYVCLSGCPLSSPML